MLYEEIQLDQQNRLVLVKELGGHHPRKPFLSVKILE